MVNRLPQYDAGQTYVARRKFSINGEVFEAGQDVPRGLVDERRYQLLFQSRHLVGKPAVNGRGANGTGVPVVPKNMKPADSEAPKPGVFHTARGWYTVTWGDRSDKVRGEADAKARFAEISGGVPLNEDGSPVGADEVGVANGIEGQGADGADGAAQADSSNQETAENHGGSQGAGPSELAKAETPPALAAGAPMAISTGEQRIGPDDPPGGSWLDEDEDGEPVRAGDEFAEV